jgi:hypothetical protein
LADDQERLSISQRAAELADKPTRSKVPNTDNRASLWATTSDDVDPAGLASARPRRSQIDVDASKNT